MGKWIHVHLRLSKRQVDCLDKLSEETGFDRTNLIRLAIARMIESENVASDALPRLDEDS
jgi:predicted DNA-binding protein